LPVHMLDRMAIKHELTAIGKTHSE
jgi:hypothetical protein